MEEKVLTFMETTTIEELKKENEELREQIKMFEFERDIKSAYTHSWSESTCIKKYGEDGLFNVVETTSDLNTNELHNLFLKYGYEFVDNYFKKKHEEWIESHKQDESEEDE